MTAEDIIKAVNKVSGIDIKERTRIQYIVICRYMYYKISKEFIYKASQDEIAKAVNQRNPSMVFALKKIDNDLKILKYKNLYSKILIELGIKQEITKTENNHFKELNNLSDSEISEFKETRLKPFLAMLETRRKHKHITEVKGALLR